MSGAPHSPQAEWSVIGQMLTKPNVIAEVIGQQIELDDFFRPDSRLIFEAAVQSYYADERVDPVTIGDRLRSPLARQWGCDEGDVPTKLYEQVAAYGQMDSVLDHARLVKRHSNNRRLLALMESCRHAITEGEQSPEEIGDTLATEATKVVTGTEKRAEILSFGDVGREYVRYLRRLKLAREQGVELAVYSGLKFFDYWTKGLAPSELMLLAGEPGVGKSAVAWNVVQGFARRQMLKPEDQRVAALVLSMEMSLVGSSGRLAQSMTRISGEKLREGSLSDDELSTIIARWKNTQDLPLYWNFASNFRMSQMRALVVEAIRRHNVGFVLIDHFRMFDPDRRINNPNQEDEAKARFLKEDIAKDLNVAVLSLAHTVKIKREGTDGRPVLSDLRGSGQVAAHCDVVAFMYSPWMYATENEKLEGVVRETDAEMIYRKNRNGALGTSSFTFDAAVMDTKDQF